MKKILSILLLLIVTVTIFSGCSSEVVIANDEPLSYNEERYAEETSENELEETRLTPPALPED